MQCSVLGQWWEGVTRAFLGWNKSKHSGKQGMWLDGKRLNSGEVTHRALVRNLRRENDWLENGSPAEINLGASYELSVKHVVPVAHTAEANKMHEVITLLYLVLFVFG